MQIVYKGDVLLNGEELLGTLSDGVEGSSFVKINCSSFERLRVCPFLERFALALGSSLFS